MKTFKDKESRQWEVKITIGSIERVKGLTGVDLLEDSGEDLQKVTGNPLTFGPVLFALVKPQADATGVNSESFTDALAGDELLAAMEAFEEEYIDFFPNPRKRQLIRTALERAKKAENGLMDTIESRLPAVIDQLEERARAKLSSSLPE